PAGTKSPLTAVATFASAKPSSRSSSSSVATRISRVSPFTSILIHYLRAFALHQPVGRHARQRGREQEAMAKQAIHMEHAAALADARQVVGKGRARIGADLEHFGF